MARPNRTDEKRRALIDIVATTFAELGYRRTSTAELARRCDVRENVLYRLWPDKKAMFVAAIDHVYDATVERWQALLDAADGPQSVAEQLLDLESLHHGALGWYRIVFAGLNETDDPDVRKAIRRMYRHFHKLIREQMERHRAGGGGERTEVELSAWGIIGLATMANISREFGLMADDRRRRLFAEVGRDVLEGRRG